MQNNYSKAQVTQSPNNKDMWTLPNKDLVYDQVVKQTAQTALRSGQSAPFEPLPSREVPIIEEQPSDSKPYNTLFVDRNCASCSGFAPQILKQIKLACLSYVNSPIPFGTEKLTCSEMVQVKEMVLKKCEHYASILSQVHSTKSAYGELEITQSSTDNEIQKTGRKQIVQKVNLNFNLNNTDRAAPEKEQSFAVNNAKISVNNRTQHSNRIGIEESNITDSQSQEDQIDKILQPH